MYKGLLHLHSFLRWVILILFLVAIYKSLADRNKPFGPGHRKTGMFLMIACDIMLLLGLYQWFTGGKGYNLFKEKGFSEVMKTPLYRFFAVEHITAMIIAIILVHVGYGYAKKNVSDSVKHKRTILFFGLALLIVLISIPWPFRAVGIGRTWFPGM